MPENDLSRGILKIRLTEGRSLRPVAGAMVEITYEGDPQGETIRLTTDESGMTEEIELPAPELTYSLSDSEQQPYALYTVRVAAPGYEDVEVAGTEVLPGVTAIQEIAMEAGDPADFERIVIGPHVLFGNYPPKIAEPEVVPMTETGEIVLSREGGPAYVVVQAGAPTE
ncbi:MAG: carboxypeptidase-like regulatory domain-containing protein, partial [Lachnospiraceae bacterium]|nr:carboxypeptidase-like regulatory domain-containing protein [Lachnospiraceae bacterium]